MLDTRARILGEATRQLTELGYPAFTVAAVRDALGLSSGSMFHAVASKAALAAAVFVEGMSDYQRAASQVIHGVDDAENAVRSLVAVHLEALLGALDRAESDGAVVLLTGRERIFSGGYDLKMFSESPRAIVSTLRLGAKVVARLADFPFPVLAVCAGHAVAQGAFTLLAADVRLGAAGPFKLGLNEVVIGLTIPHYGVEIARSRLSPSYFSTRRPPGRCTPRTKPFAPAFSTRFTRRKSSPPALWKRRSACVS